MTFDDFVATHSRRLLHFAELLIGTTDAEDLVQGVLLRMYGRWDKIEQGDPIGYARRSLANSATDRWRRRRFKEVLVDNVPDRAIPGSESEAQADRESVLRALSRLPPRERAVIVLAYYEDRTEQQIASDLGIAPGTVKSTRSRALAKLRVSQDLQRDPSTVEENAQR